MDDPLVPAPGTVILIFKDSIGNPRQAMVRVERATASDGGRVHVEGVEVTRNGHTRLYFRRHYSQWNAWLKAGDFAIVDTPVVR